MANHIDEVTINGYKLIYDKDKGCVTIVKSEESVPNGLEEELEEWDWEKFRREAAKDIVCAVLAGGIANGAKGFDAQKEGLVNVSIGVADELIKQLREAKK